MMSFGQHQKAHLPMHVKCVLHPIHGVIERKIAFVSLYIGPSLDIYLATTKYSQFLERQLFLFLIDVE